MPDPSQRMVYGVVVAGIRNPELMPDHPCVFSRFYSRLIAVLADTREWCRRDRDTDHALRRMAFPT